MYTRGGLAHGIARLGSGFVGRALEEQVHSVVESYADLLQEKTELQTALDDKRITDEDITAAMQFRHDLAVGIKNPTFEYKRRIFELLQVKVIFKDGKSQLVCLVPNNLNLNCTEHSDE